jgi:DNA-binding response OmpR family regulator
VCLIPIVLDVRKGVSRARRSKFFKEQIQERAATMRIIIADADWHFELQATRYFESRTHLVVHETPERVLDHARSWRPDLIVLAAEYVSEELFDGLRLLDCPPAILLTEHMSRFDRAWRVWQMGGDELLMKPIFSVHDLQESVVAALEHAALNSTGLWRPAAVSA